MKLRAVRVADVGGFEEPVAVEGLSGRLDLLLGPNETGKSTLFRALQAVFFKKYNATGRFLTKLTPTRGGTPLIEADFEVAGTTWRITKQYGSGKTATLQVVGGGASWRNADAEAKLYELLDVADGLQGRFGTLWVGQRHGLGAPVLDLDPETKRVKVGGGEQQALLAAIEQEIDDTAGGSLAGVVRDVLLAKAKLLLTDSIAKPQQGGPKARPRCDGPLDRALSLCAELSDALDVARQRADETAESRLRLEAIESDLVALTAPHVVNHREARLSEAQQTYEAAKMAADRLKLQASERDRAEAVAAREEAAAKRFCEKLAAAEALFGQQHDAMAKRNELVETIKVAETEQARLVEQVAQLTSARDQNQLALERCVRAERLADIHNQRDRIEADLTRVRTFEEDIGRLNEALREMHVSAELCDEARAAQRDIELAASRLDTAATWLEVDYLPGKDGGLLVGDQPLKGEERIRITDPTHVVIPGVGQLLLSPGDTADISDAKDQHAAASRRLAEMLEVAGVGDISTLEAALDERRKTERALSEAVATLNGLAPDGSRRFQARLDELADQALAISDAAPKGPDDMAGGIDGQGGALSVDDMEALVTASQNELDAAQVALQGVENTFKTAELELSHCQEKLAAFETKIVELNAELGPDDERLNLADTLKETAAAAMALAHEARLVVVAAREDVPDEAALAALQTQVTEAEQAIRQAADRAALLKDERAERIGLISAYDEDGQAQRVAELSGELARAQREADRLTDQAEGLKLAIGALDAARAQSHDRFARPVYKALAPFLELVFGESEIVFDSAFRPVEVRRAGIADSFDFLSEGTQEQIGLLVRLAFGRVFADAGQSTPIILDDPLAYADDVRIAKTFEALETASQSQQIFLMTCRDAAFRKLGGHMVQIAPWSPDAVRPSIRSAEYEKKRA